LVSIGTLFAHLFFTPVDIPDIWINTCDSFTVERNFEMHHTMGSRVMWADIQKHRVASRARLLLVYRRMNITVLFAQWDDLWLILIERC
jgi:hypothetical protein